MLMQWPASLGGGRQLIGLLRILIILPTLLDIAGRAATADVNLDGVSLLPLLRKGKGC